MEGEIDVELAGEQAGHLQLGAQALADELFQGGAQGLGAATRTTVAGQVRGLLDGDVHRDEVVLRLRVEADAHRAHLADGHPAEGHRRAGVEAVQRTREKGDTVEPLVPEPEAAEHDDGGQGQAEGDQDEGSDHSGVGFLAQTVRTSRFPVPRVRKLITVGSSHSCTSRFGSPVASMVRASLSRNTELVAMA